MRHATPADTPVIYGLLEAVQFQNLPEYDKAKPVIEDTHGLLFEHNGKLAMFVGLFKKDDGKLGLDVAVAPDYSGKIITRKICKQVLTYCHTIADSIYVECYNPRAVKLALLLGFELTPEDDRAGFITLRKQDHHG